MADKILIKKDSSNIFGRLLFITIIIMLLAVYIALIFNRMVNKIDYIKYWFLYIIFGILLFSLIIFLHPSLLRIKESMSKRIEIEKKEKIRREEMLRLKEEKRRKLLKKEKKLGIEEEKNKEKESIKKEKVVEEKRPSIFSKLFKKEECKGEILSEKESRKAERLRLKEERMEKKEEEKIRKMLEKERRKAEKLRLEEEKRGKLLEKEKERLEEKRPSIFSKLLERKPEEQEKKPKKEKITLVKELSRNLKIDIGKYETDIDALYKIIEKTGRIKLSAISTYFGIDKRKAEEWATILQEHNLAEIHYPAMGGPEIRKKLTKQA